MSNIDDNEQIEQAAEKIMGILTRDEPRKSFDSYAHPDTKERAKSGIMAVKPSNATVKESLTVQAIMPPTSEFKICGSCGSHFLPYKNGCIKPTVCRDCMTAKIQKGMLRHYGKEAPKNTMEEKQEQPPILTLVFSGKNDARIYEAVCASAEVDRRTPENQIIHFLEMALNGFGADVTFALEETINREE